MEEKVNKEVQHEISWLNRKHRIEESLSLLEYEGGRSLEYNPYKDTILQLRGLIVGIELMQQELDL